MTRSGRRASPDHPASRSFITRSRRPYGPQARGRGRVPQAGSRLARGPLAGPRDGPLRAGRCRPSAGQGYEAPPPRKSGTVQLQRATQPTLRGQNSTEGARGPGAWLGPSTAGRDRGRPPRLARAALGRRSRRGPDHRPAPPWTARTSRTAQAEAAPAPTSRVGTGQRLPGRATLETELPTRRRLTPYGRPYGVAYGHRPAPTLPARKGSRGPHVVTGRTDSVGTWVEAMARPPDSRSLPVTHEGWPLPPAAPRPRRGPVPTMRPWPARTR